MKYELFSSDVLVIGSGGAGIMAAIKASANDSSVTLVSKGPVGSGATAWALAGMAASFGEVNSKDNPTRHMKDTIVNGLYLNDQNLVKIMTKEIIPRIHELESWGSVFVKVGKKHDLRAALGHKYPRVIHNFYRTGAGIMKGLLPKIKQTPVNIFQNVMITSILTNSDGVCGAFGFDYKEGSFYAFEASAIVLATGGLGTLYELTDNPSHLSGDGYILALQAGAELVDMEMISFQPYVCSPPRLRGMHIQYPYFYQGSPPLTRLGGKYYNRKGERFIRKYDPIKMENTGNNALLKSIYYEICQGNSTENKGVYLDLSSIPTRELEEYQSEVYQRCQSVNLNLSWQPLEVSIGAHYECGGVKINEKTETGVPGLFAAGEVTGGIHGAYRVFGNALTDIFVFGARAGTFATQYAKKHKKSLKRKQIEQEKDRIVSLLNRRGGQNHNELKRKIQNVASTHLSVVRSNIGLRLALTKFSNLERNLSKISLQSTNNHEEFCNFLETMNLLTLGQIVSKSAFLREESRGLHFREDYPKKDDEKWLKHIVTTLEGATLKNTMVSITFPVDSPPSQPTMSPNQFY